jgi:hypothetical protein
MRIVRSKIFHLLCMLPMGISFVSGYLNGSAFEMTCAFSAVLYLLIQFCLSSFLDKDGNTQNEQRRPVSFFLLFPPVLTITGGILLLFLPVFKTMSGSYFSICSPAVLQICLTLRLISLIGNTTLAGRILKLTVAASMSAPLSLAVTLLLHLLKAEDAAALSSLTTIVLGGLAFFIMVNIIMVSYCGYKGTVESIKIISRTVKEKRLVFIRVSMIKDAFFVAGKSAMSIISLSFFMFVNALYSAGMGIARFIAVRMHRQDRANQVKSYRYVGIIISIASICYALYSVRLFFGGATGSYDMNIALVIALYTFIEFGINIREAIRLRKSNALETKALRAIGFSSTLICFVLTQTAILSFASEGGNSFFNALSGVVFGGLAALAGLHVIRDSFTQQRVSAS